jgi:hypothetical protein
LNQRQVIEATNEANTIKSAIEKAEKEPAWQHLTYDEVEAIKAAMMELDASVKGGDYKVIRRAIESLDKKTRRLADIMMNSTLSEAMTGKTMEAAGEGMGEGPTAPHVFAPAQIDDSK